jgi:hypothetical protein
LKNERRVDAQSSLSKFMENFKIGIYDDINLEVDERVEELNSFERLYNFIILPP